MKDKKSVPMFFRKWDHEWEEKFINQQAEKGWQLVKAGMYHHTYRRGTEDYRYRMDYFSPGDKSPEYQRYIDLQNEMGWELVNKNFHCWYYWRKRYVPGTDESEYQLYTDNESYQGMLKSWMIVCRVGQIYWLIYGLFEILLDFPSHLVAYDCWKIALFIALVSFIEVEIRILKRKRLGKKKRWNYEKISRIVMLALTIVCFIGWIVAVSCRA